MKRPSYLRKRLKSFSYALAGLRSLWKSEAHSKIHAIATFVVIMAGIGIGISPLEWFMVMAAVVLVWITEAINTGLESLCDLVHPDPHPLVKKVKDIAAGAVLIAALFALGVGIAVFLPHFIR